MTGAKPDINALIEEHQFFVRELAARLAPLPRLAEDIAQQVFLEFLAKAERWDLERDVRPLLATMTRHISLRAWRERSRSMSLELRGLVEHVRELVADAPEPVSHGAEERLALDHCLGELPEKSRHLIQLHYFRDVSSAEIARQMEIQGAAVRRALFRLRQRLRKCIDATVKGGGHA